MTKYRIPVRVVPPPVTPHRTRVSEVDLRNEAASEEPIDVRSQTEETASKAVSSSADQVPECEVPRISNSGVQEQDAAQRVTQDTLETKERGRSYRSSEVEVWKRRALQLEDDMAAYRRRQKRIAHEEARAEQVALLKDVLTIADNLDRALAVAQERPQMYRRTDTLSRGVELTRTSLERTLAKHGLERMQVEGEPFDPTWHEAVHVVPATAFGVTPGTVVEVLEAGYRRHDTLFRPAKVVVAQ